jgi:hypothetical protein
MKKCEVCGTRILFGPVREGRHEYCSNKCRDQATSMVAISTIPNELVIKNVHEVFRGDCPECGREGPVDVHISHTVWSIVAMTSFKSNPKICCRRCGRLARIKAALFSGLFGWWGFPWGNVGDSCSDPTEFRQRDKLHGSAEQITLRDDTVEDGHRVFKNS